MMEEVDIVTDQRRILELGICFDANHGDRIVQNHGEKSMESVRWKAVQMDGDSGDDGSHVQDAFGRRLKIEGLIYPGNYPDRIMPKIRAELGPEGRKAELESSEK